MWIKSKESPVYANMDTASLIFANDEGELQMRNSNSMCRFVLGKYGTKEKAQKVLEDIFEAYLSNCDIYEL